MKSYMLGLLGAAGLLLLKKRGFSLGKMPNWSRMTEAEIERYLRKNLGFDDQGVNEFMYSFREARALRVLKAPDFAAMSESDLYRYIMKVSHLSEADSAAMLRIVDSVMLDRLSSTWLSVKYPDLRKTLKAQFGFNENELALVLRAYEELILKQQIARATPKTPTGWTEQVYSAVVPSWLTTKLFSLRTLRRIPKGVVEFTKSELKQLTTPTGIAGVVAAVVIGPEILAYWGFTGAVEAITFSAVDYWIAASNSKQIIDAVLESNKAPVVVIADQLVSAALSGGVHGGFVRAIMGSLAGNQVAFQLEQVL